LVSGRYAAVTEAVGGSISAARCEADDAGATLPERAVHLDGDQSIDQRKGRGGTLSSTVRPPDPYSFSGSVRV